MRVEDVIQVALDAAQEKRPGWFLRASETLGAIDARYLGRRGQQLAIAQCVRGLDSGDPKVTWTLYRIWGKTKLVKTTPARPFLIASLSYRNKKDGELAFFGAEENSTDIPEDANGNIWPLSTGKHFGDSADWWGTTLEDAFRQVGITHAVPCDAFVRNPRRRR